MKRSACLPLLALPLALQIGCGRGDTVPAAPAGHRSAGALDPNVIELPEDGKPATRQVTLYFISESGRFRPERRVIASERTPDAQARRIIEELIKGPTGLLGRVLPLGTGLRAIYLRPDGAAYVDFDAGFSRGLAGGSEDGITAIWAVTDTLAANFPDVTHVKILVEGEEVRDLGGHLDLSRPFVPDMSLVEDYPADGGPDA